MFQYTNYFLHIETKTLLCACKYSHSHNFLCNFATLKKTEKLNSKNLSLWLLLNPLKVFVLQKI